MYDKRKAQSSVTLQTRAIIQASRKPLWRLPEFLSKKLHFTETNEHCYQVLRYCYPSFIHPPATTPDDSLNSRQGLFPLPGPVFSHITFNLLTRTTSPTSSSLICNGNVFTFSWRRSQALFHGIRVTVDPVSFPLPHRPSVITSSTRFFASPASTPCATSFNLVRSYPLHNTQIHFTQHSVSQPLRSTPYLSPRPIVITPRPHTSHNFAPSGLPLSLANSISLMTIVLSVSSLFSRLHSSIFATSWLI